MLKNYLIISFRNIIRNRFFTFINIFGLSVGIASTLLIYLYIIHELNYDKYHKNSKLTYRVVFTTSEGEKASYSCLPLVPALRNNLAIPKTITGLILKKNELLATNTNKFNVENIIYVEPQYFEVFDVDWVVGSQDVFNAPDAAVLTESYAKKLFGSLDIYGKTISLKGKQNFIVKGIVRDNQGLTNFPYNILLSYNGYPKSDAAFNYDSWDVSSGAFQTFVVLKSKADKVAVEQQITEIYKKNRPDDKSERKYFLQPITEIRTNADYGLSNFNGYTNVKYFIIASIVGVFIILLGCINYINLALSLFMKRRKEVGVRKVCGADNKSVMTQFTIETTIILIVSLMFAMVLTELLLPYASNLLEGHVYTNIYQKPSIFVFIVLLFIILTIITGILPSVRISTIKAVDIFKKDIDSIAYKAFNVRNTLIIFQFLVSIVLIIATIIITSQLRFIQNKDLGFSSKNILLCPVPSDAKAKILPLKEQLKQVAGIESFSFGLGAPTSSSNMSEGIQSPYKMVGDKTNVSYKFIDYSYNTTYGLKLVAGRWWNQDYAPDSLQEYVVNESYIKGLNYPSIEKTLGALITVAGNRGIIVGVIQDFHTSSLRNPIEPVVFARFRLFQTLGIKLKESYNSSTIAQIKEKWEAAYPESLWEYEFLDDYLNKQYNDDNRTYKLALISSFIAVCIALLGLFSISGYTIQQKTKSICIRKIFGAQVSGLIIYLSKKFIYLVLFAGIMGIPICYYFMEKWLQGFAYRIEIKWYYFAATLIVSLLISFFIISYYAIKTSRENPVDVLRYE